MLNFIKIKEYFPNLNVTFSTDVDESTGTIYINDISTGIYIDDGMWYGDDADWIPFIIKDINDTLEYWKENNIKYEL